MNYYETLYIIHPALDAGRIKEMVLSIDQVLEKNKGKRVSLDVWGKKKLAYEIDKQKYGTYILMQFTGDGSGNSKFNMEIEHNTNKLAYLTTSINRDDVIEQDDDLETQIAGKTREAERNESRYEKDVDNKLYELEKKFLDDHMAKIFAIVKDACRRLCKQKYMVMGQEVEWNMIPYDVQLIGGVVLHQGKIAEMKTGEGKTLVSTLAIILNAITGRGLHDITVNDYLAERDSQWMGIL